MSIYSSWQGLSMDHEDDCGIWVELEPDCFEMGDEAGCTCGLPRAPLVYQGSHVLPSDDDQRCGGVEIASIPDHIERPDRPEVPEGTPKPWLRLSVHGREADATVVLTRRHVEILREEFSLWLEYMGDDGEGA